MERNHQQDQQQQPSQQRMKPPEAQNHHQPPPPQKCPRCDSSNTKFCYYNNYSLSQPRYFCKACRRYWTQGGTLRNVPVGGGCRKSKRPKPSIPSSSSSEIGGRTQSSSPAPPPQNLTDMSPGHGFRPLPPGMSSMGHTFYTGGSFMSSLVPMQNLPAGINQGAAANLGGGNSNYDPNMAVLQGFQPLKPQPPQQFQVQNHDQYFPSHQGSLSIPTRPSLTSWTQNFINRGPAATSSAATSGFWTESADGGSGGGNQAGSSLNPSHWQENNPGFDPSQ